MNKQYLLLGTVFAILMIPVASVFGSEIVMHENAGSSSCTMTDTCYTPSSLIVKRGAEVLIKNNDVLPHTVTDGLVSEDNPGELFDTELMPTNSEATITVPQKDGLYEYFCLVHPWMVGEIIVVKDIYDYPLGDVPEWFETTIQWYNEGKIPEQEFYWAVGYMSDKGLLTVP